MTVMVALMTVMVAVMTSDDSDGSSDDINGSTDDSSDDSTDSNEASSLLEVSPYTNLFKGSTMSVQQCTVAIMSMFHKHNLSYACINDILKLMEQALLEDNLLPCTCHSIINEFVKYKENTMIHNSCSFCTQLLSTDSKCSQRECQTSEWCTGIIICSSFPYKSASNFVLKYN